MDELVKLLSEKLGISEDVARKAVLISGDYLRTKLPEHIFTDVDAILETSNATQEEIVDLGLFRLP